MRDHAKCPDCTCCGSRLHCAHLCGNWPTFGGHAQKPPTVFNARGEVTR